MTIWDLSHYFQTVQSERVCDLSNISQWSWMTTSDKFQRHSFKVAFKLTAKSERSHILTFDILKIVCWVRLT